MWPWKSKQPDLATLPPIGSDEHLWAVKEAGYNNAPVLIRENTSAKPWVAHKSLGIKLGFAIPFNHANEGGLPNPDENEQLHAVEDVILHEVSARATGIHVLVLTTGVMREMVFYITEGADIGAIHQTIMARVPSHEVQCMAVRDPKWEAYAPFMSK